MSKCEDCEYLRKERAGFWIDAGATRAEADTQGARERCPKHARATAAGSAKLSNPRKHAKK